MSSWSDRFLVSEGHSVAGRSTPGSLLLHINLVEDAAVGELCFLRGCDPAEDFPPQ